MIQIFNKLLFDLGTSLKPIRKTRRRVDPTVRFWSKVEKTSTCWLWRGYLMPSGYGQFGLNYRMTLVHRWSYEEAYGPIPKHKEIDHLCSNRACVRPSHLQAVTHLVNVQRGGGRSGHPSRELKTHCPYGHSYRTESYPGTQGRRHCRVCKREYARRKVA